MGAPMYRVDTNLYGYCTVAQLEKLEAINKHKSLKAAARALGLSFSNVRDALVAVERKAAIHGYSPQHDLTNKVAPGFVAKGHSTLYDKRSGEAIVQWVKTTRDQAQQEEIIRAAVTALMDDVPRAKPAKAPKHTATELCNLFTFTDCHVGLKAWGKETGADWDLDIAESMLCASFGHMVNAAPAAATAIVAQLGDFLHFDSLVPETPTSRHPLDADSRYSKVVRVAVRILRSIVDAALLRHETVYLLNAEGNHDMAGSVWIRHLFELLYENEPRLKVIDSEIPYYVHQHGEVMLGWHHGHTKKKDALPLLFAAQYPQVWGSTKKRYLHTGHLHHVDEKEHPGVYVIQHPTMAARDAWAARGGYLSERQITAMTYHRKFGNVARNTVTPDMLEAAA